MGNIVYTYLHCKPDGTPFYVGLGKGKRAHHFAARNKLHKRVVAEFGKENIGVFIFPCESNDQAKRDEIQQIAQLRQEGFELANISAGGQGNWGSIFSAEHKAKIGAANKGKRSLLGRKRPPHECAAIGARMRGKIVSAETKARQSAAAKARWAAAVDEKRRMSDLYKGKPWPIARRLAQVRRSGDHREHC